MRDPRLAFLLRGRGTQLATMVIAAVVVASVAVPLISSWGVQNIDWDAIDTAPSTAHWFGTDGSGRDLLARTFSGGQMSLTIALLATSVSFAIGLPWGAVAGFFGGRVDQLMMRTVDALYGLPFIFLVIILVVVFGRNTMLLFIALGAVSWLDLARIVRGQTLVVRNQAFIEAARAMGLTRAHIVIRHVLPNVLTPALVYATLTIPGVIIAESFISFLGLGVQEPNTSWGVLIAEGTRQIHSSPWQLIFPAALLALTLLALNVVGDRLRDALDVQTLGRTK